MLDLWPMLWQSDHMGRPLNNNFFQHPPFCFLYQTAWLTGQSVYYYTEGEPTFLAHNSLSQGASIIRERKCPSPTCPLSYETDPCNIWCISQRVMGLIKSCPATMGWNNIRKYYNFCLKCLNESMLKLSQCWVFWGEDVCCHLFPSS